MDRNEANLWRVRLAARDAYYAVGPASDIYAQFDRLEIHAYDLRHMAIMAEDPAQAVERDQRLEDCAQDAEALKAQYGIKTYSGGAPPQPA